MPVFIADIASYQQGLVPAELKPDCAGLFIKAAQGSAYVDPDYAGWLAESKTAGLLTAAYHYLDGTSPAAQAAWLKAHIIDAALPVMLDFEAGGFQQALEVADAMASVGLRPRLLYFAHARWVALGSPPLLASLTSRSLSLINAAYPSSAAGSPAHLYPGDNATEWASYGGVTPALWQFTDAGEESGQRVDINAYKGSAAQLAALLGTADPAPPGTPAPAAPKLSWPTVSPGNSGPWVTLLQRALMLAGQDPHGVDGSYGGHTKAAVDAAQRAFGIQADSQVGPITWQHLQARTLVVQRALVERGLGAGGTDSTAGPATASELVAFQREHKLLQDGICGTHTSSALGIPAV